MQPVTVTVVISCHQFWPLVLWPMAPLSSRREGPPPGQCCFSFLFWSAGSFSVLAWLTLALLVSSLPLFSILSLINHHFASLSNILYDSSTLNTSKMKYVLDYMYMNVWPKNFVISFCLYHSFIPSFNCIIWSFILCQVTDQVTFLCMLIVDH